MTTKPKAKKHVRMIEFEPTDSEQEKRGLELLETLKIIKLEIYLNNTRNVFTIKYLNEPND